MLNERAQKILYYFFLVMCSCLFSANRKLYWGGIGRYRPASDGFRWFNRSGVFTVDIVEGVVNKGIYLNGDRGATFLHFGNYKNSCISDPTLCGPQGKAPLITPSLFSSSLALSVCLSQTADGCPSFSPSFFFHPHTRCLSFFPLA